MSARWKRRGGLNKITFFFLFCVLYSTAVETRDISWRLTHLIWGEFYGEDIVVRRTLQQTTEREEKENKEVVEEEEEEERMKVGTKEKGKEELKQEMRVNHQVQNDINTLTS